MIRLESRHFNFLHRRDPKGFFDARKGLLYLVLHDQQVLVWEPVGQIPDGWAGPVSFNTNRATLDVDDYVELPAVPSADADAGILPLTSNKGQRLNLAFRGEEPPPWKILVERAHGPRVATALSTAAFQRAATVLGAEAAGLSVPHADDPGQPFVLAGENGARALVARACLPANDSWEERLLVSGDAKDAKIALLSKLLREAAQEIRDNHELLTRVQPHLNGG